MIENIDMQMFKTLKTEDKLNNLASKLNEVINALNVGIVHDNKIAAERANIKALASVADTEYRRISNEFTRITGGKI